MELEAKMKGGTRTITRLNKRGIKRRNLKAMNGRGRKPSAWIEELPAALISEELDMLRKLGMKRIFEHGQRKYIGV